MQGEMEEAACPAEKATQVRYAEKNIKDKISHTNRSCIPNPNKSTK